MIVRGAGRGEGCCGAMSKQSLLINSNLILGNWRKINFQILWVFFFLNALMKRVTSNDNYIQSLFFLSFFLYWGIAIPGAFLVAQMVKNLPAMQETQVRSLGQEDPLEKGMATHFSILAWRIPEETFGLQSMGSQRVGYD